MLPDAQWINLLDEVVYQEHLADIGLFARRLNSVARGGWVVVDEVQRLPQLLNEVHRYIEDKGIKFALSGSSARKLKRAGVNLLGGRASLRIMMPFVPEELGQDFDWERALTLGTLPLIYADPDPEEALASYIRMYLKEEIQAEALVRNLPGFARFLPIAALCHGQNINTSNIARDAEVSRTTVVGYLEILEDTLMTFKLPGYTPKVRVRESQHPKLYWIDPGLVCALKKRSGSSLNGEEKGALFEGWIASLLYAYKQYRDLFDEWAYWRPTESDNAEVDFVLSKNDQIILIEVKSGDKVRTDFFRGIRACVLKKPILRKIVIYRGTTNQKTDDNIEVMPVTEFVKEVEQGTLFTE